MPSVQGIIGGPPCKQSFSMQFSRDPGLVAGHPARFRPHSCSSRLRSPRLAAINGSQSSGDVPNLLWQGITLDELRQHANFQGLPPVQDVMMTGHESYRYVRQGSGLWERLRAGMLLRQALGLPEHFADHAKTLSTYERLRLPTYTPDFQARVVNGSNAAPVGAPVSEADLLASIAQERACIEKRSVEAAFEGVHGVRLAWGTAQEAAALAGLMAAFPTSTLHEIGLCWLDTSTLPTDWGFLADSLPPLAASPDGLLFSPQEDIWDSALADDAAGSPACSSEIVEVKNTCPFRRSRGGSSFYIHDMGPRSHVPVMWVAQMQMEMLACPHKSPSALLVSRSATQGMTIFRMERSPEFQRSMLSVISRFWTEYVCKGVRPPENVHSDRGSSAHMDLLSLVRNVADSCEVVMHIEEPGKAPNHDARVFL
ncbi:hypothetical protein WJX73_001321 [Symbiochloris irregularis]|uniref:YqaJ viral recombinase domain-containing protein n=1 Tax=Symbiochloris irregularis TaxID=706552 RepID=A0AAW1NMK3_9CHLO